MKICRIINPTRETVVCPKCQIADTIWTRGKGLLGRKTLPEDEGILLIPGTSIHMFGLQFSIDVLFLTTENVVTDLRENIGPGQLHIAKSNCGKPFAALEVAPGTIQKSQTQIGDILQRDEALGAGHEVET